MVEFADTDMAGIVHFARFFVFMEATEHEFWRHLGLGVQQRHQDDTISWPRTSASCDYYKPLYFEDHVDIGLSLELQGDKTLLFHFNFRRAGEHIAIGEIKTICCICNPGEKMRPIIIPDFIIHKLAAQ